MFGIDTITTFGKWLKERRQSLDLTQENLADRVGCALSTIEKVERGLRRPSHQIAACIAKELRIPPDDQEAFVAWARGVTSTWEVSQDATSRGTLNASGGAPQKRPGNVPAPATALIGRKQVLEEISILIRQPDVRLLTLLGPPGIGKTRLSLALAEALWDDFADGVWFVPLAAISDPALVGSSIAKALGLKEAPSQSVHVSLLAYLRDKELLLVLDNFEQIAEAAPLVSELLAASPGLKVLITSRAALNIYGERHFDVPPLDVPDPVNLPLSGALQSFPAVALFIQRAQAVVPRFNFTVENGQAIAEICARLDGLPLAIELAAARSKLFDPLSILRRLDRRLPLLSGGPHDRTPRQQSLRGAIGWSYDLLSDNEKALFRRLSVFVGGCTLEAFERVVAGVEMDEQGQLSGTEVLLPADELGSLVNKSLVQRLEVEGEVRFSMLETLREYAGEQLSESGEADTTRLKHAEYFSDFVKRAASKLTGAEQKLWADRLEQEHDNLRSSLSWALARAEKEDTLDAQESTGDIAVRDETQFGAAETALRLGGDLWRFWAMRGYSSEGRAWLQLALKAATRRTAARANAANGAARLATGQGDYAEVEALHQQALQIYQELGDKQGISRSLNGLGLLRWKQSEYSAARSIFEETLAINQEIGDSWGIGASIANIGLIAFNEGDNVVGRHYMERGASVFRELGDKSSLALMLNNLGVIAQTEGDLDAAGALWGECLAVFRELDNKASVGLALVNLAVVERDLGKVREALAFASEGLALLMEVGDRQVVIHTLSVLAGMAAMQRRPEVAARLYGACQALLVELDVALPPANQADHDRYLEDTRSMLDGARLEACWAEGRAMAMSEAIEYALDANAIEADQHPIG